MDDLVPVPFAVGFFQGGVFQGGFRLTVSLQGDLVHEPEERGRWRGMGWGGPN